MSRGELPARTPASPASLVATEYHPRADVRSGNYIDPTVTTTMSPILTTTAAIASSDQLAAVEKSISFQRHLS